MSNELDNLESKGVITKVESSEWAAPIVPVIKSDGSIRVCGDFKVTINPVLKDFKYHLPRVEDVFASLAGGQQFSKLDLKQAYLQMEVGEGSKEYLTVNTHNGLYQYNRLQYGIKTAPAIWQKIIDEILQGISGVQVLLDDIIITGRNRDEHLQRMEEVLMRLELKGL